MWRTFYHVVYFIFFDTDCQQKAGPSAWTPFHESASAVTQLYKGMYFREWSFLRLHCHNFVFQMHWKYAELVWRLGYSRGRKNATEKSWHGPKRNGKWLKGKNCWRFWATDRIGKHHHYIIATLYQKIPQHIILAIMIHYTLQLIIIATHLAGHRDLVYRLRVILSQQIVLRPTMAQQCWALDEVEVFYETILCHWVKILETILAEKDKSIWHSTIQWNNLFQREAVYSFINSVQH